MTDQNNAISIARLEMEVGYLKSGMAALQAVNADQSQKLDKLIRTMDEAQGGWRVLVMIGGAAGSLGGLIAWVASHIKG